MNLPPISFISGVHIPSLEGFHDHLLDIAAEVIATGEELPSPTIYVLSNAGELAIIAPMGSKESSAGYQKAVVKVPIVRACALVFEAWISTHPGGVDKERVGLPSEDPNRTEAVGVSLMTAGRQAFTFSPIERPANIVRKAPFKWLDESDGAYKGRFIRDKGASV